LKHENAKIRVFSPKTPIRPKIKGENGVVSGSIGVVSGENGGFSGKIGGKRGRKIEATCPA
jgi:hypothetical protein